MMIRVSGEFLDFNEEIEVEKQIKLFEDISTTDGDFSYQFDLPKTLNNTRILQNPFPDNISKPVYQRINADLLSNSGAELYKGYLRIERVTNVYAASFFAGNNNWFGRLSDSLRSLDWSEYDIEQNEANILASFNNTEGLVFPLVDNGLLFMRGNPQLRVEDFVAGIYVKSIFQKVFAAQGIKIQGELFDDVTFNSAIILSNSKNDQAITDRSSFVKTTNAPTNHASEIYTKVVWTDETTYPYFDGATNNFDLPNSRYVADVPMVAKFEWIINNTIAPGIGSYIMAFYVNGISFYEVSFPSSPVQPLTLTKIIQLNTGDIVETYVMDDAQLFADPITDSTWRITPIFVYKSFGGNMIPDWTQQELVSNILKIFNVLTWFDSTTQTLTFNLFEKIKSKPPIDLSEYISGVEVDYSEFISEYGKSSRFSFNEYETDDDFKIKNFTTRSYSKGEITVNNDFLSDTEDILESDFSNPITYVNPIFDMSIEKTDLVEVDEDLNIEASVSNNSGVARFSIAEDLFLVGDFIRISNSTNPRYNGDYTVDNIGSGFVEFLDLSFDTNATATLTKMNFVYTDNDAVYLLFHVPNYQISKFSSKSTFNFEGSDISNIAIAFFNLITLGRQIESDFIYSMTFSEGHVNLIDRYFRLFSRVLNDPVKLFATSNIPYGVFVQIDFLNPITIKTLESVNQYYLNRISGFKESYLPSTLELIKLP